MKPPGSETRPAARPRNVTFSDSELGGYNFAILHREHNDIDVTILHIHHVIILGYHEYSSYEAIGTINFAILIIQYISSFGRTSS